MFLLDMKAPGVTIRPIINMAEAHHFNEVFFDNVRIPKRDLVGEQDQGWYILATALDFERSGVHASANAQRILDKLAEFHAERPGTLTAALRNRFAEAQIETSIARSLAYRVSWLQSRGGQPNQEASLSKLYGSELGQRVAAFAIDSLGLSGQAGPGSKWAAFGGRIERTYRSPCRTPSPRARRKCSATSSPRGASGCRVRGRGRRRRCRGQRVPFLSPSYGCETIATENCGTRGSQG